MINILAIINDSFAPLAIITGVALLVLGINERYSRVMESLRSLHRDLLKEPAENRELIRCYKRQIRTLIRMAKILRAALLSMYTAIFFAIASSITILVSSLTGIPTTRIMIVAMVISLASLFIGSLFAIAHIVISLNAIQVDLAADASLQKP